MVVGVVVTAEIVVTAVPPTVFDADHALLFAYPVWVYPLIVGNVHAVL